jgi:tripeptide aminopeptidase
VTVGPLRSRVGELERRYLSGTFAELCRIESPSGSERRCAERVLAELRAIGVSVGQDDAGAQLGSDCGNLLARIPCSEEAPPAAGGERPCVLLCAHLDTVPLQAPIEPVLVDGYWENSGEGILGADNKAAVAVLLALARRIRREGAPLDVELLFTVGEEIALAGARALDTSRLRSRFGYVFDHASPIGEVITASPSHFRVDATFRGIAAHAGIRPEDGRSAILAAARAICSMRLGRLDEETTVNVGSIEGGSAMNVVPERCSLVAEVRSLRDERAEEVVAALVARLHEAANVPECECDVDVGVQRTFAGYRLAPTRPAVRAAERALLACGHDPIPIASGGASDANVLIARGLETVNLANGTERNHEPGERVREQALEEMLAVALALLDELAADSAPAAR